MLGEFVQDMRVYEGNILAVGNFYSSSRQRHQFGSVFTGHVNAEVGFPFETKNISVSRLSGDIDRHNGIGPHQILLPWNDQLINACEKYGLFESGIKGALAVPLAGPLWSGVWDIPRISERECCNKSSAVALKITGWSRSAIFHDDVEFDRLCQAKLTEKNVRVDVSPKLSHSDVGDNHEGDNKRDGLKGTDNNRGYSDISCGFVRRLTLLIISIFSAFGLAIWGGMRLDDERPVIGAALISLPIVIAAGGWFLYGASMFRDTCGWWL
jgi:hypothetical protein